VRASHCEPRHRTGHSNSRTSRRHEKAPFSRGSAVVNSWARFIRTSGHPWGVKIIRYSGELINDREANGRIDDGADGIFELAPDENIDGRSKGSLAQFINHDRKAPNCFVLRDSREIWIVAGINGVKRGQELTYDYGPDYF
jgi:SET domain-containing protein